MVNILCKLLKRILNDIKLLIKQVFYASSYKEKALGTGEDSFKVNGMLLCAV